MLSKINPTETSAWKELLAHQTDMKNIQMKELFKENPDRFEKMSIQFDEILFDYSKNIITEETLEKLLKLADECQVKIAREELFSGEKINQSEDRAVLHTALRSFYDESIILDR